MAAEIFIRSADGRRFEFLGDTYTIKRACSEGSAGYSMTHAVVAPGSFAPPHTHEKYEETFYILEGDLEFTLGHETIQLHAGDYVRAASGVRHGYVNKSERAAKMLFEFSPGGMEELLYEFRTDEKPFDRAAFLQKARQAHGTVFERPGNNQSA